jgi:protein-tyrosine phosphatase
MNVLFVCLGNICRSPLGEGILKHLALEAGFDLNVDSAGTIAHHQGEAPDRRSIEIANQHGIDISMQRSRKIETDDYFLFDVIFAMDRTNFANINANRPKDAWPQIQLLRLYDPEADTDLDVPDPYYGGSAGFQNVFTMIKRSCQGFLESKK